MDNLYVNFAILPLFPSVLLSRRLPREKLLAPAFSPTAAACCPHKLLVHWWWWWLLTAQLQSSCVVAAARSSSSLPKCTSRSYKQLAD